MNHHLLNKVILFTIEKYIDQCIKEGTEPTPLHFRILGAIKGWKTFHMFSELEAAKVIGISKDPGLKKIIDIHVSYLVFALELIKQLTEQTPKQYRPMLNISPKKLVAGRALYAVSMLKLKQRDEEQYKETKDVIDDSVIAAKHFFEFHAQRIL